MVEDDQGLVAAHGDRAPDARVADEVGGEHVELTGHEHAPETDGKYWPCSAAGRTERDAMDTKRRLSPRYRTERFMTSRAIGSSS